MKDRTMSDRPPNTLNSPSAPTPQRPQPRLLSIVVPAHNEEGNVGPLAEAIAAALGGIPWELIVVDDGSTDGTFGSVAALAAADGRVRGLSLTRNFGHQAALAAGLAAAQGDAIVMMDGDMQHPPRLLPEFVARWREGHDVVQGRREDDPSLPGWKRVTSRLFYRVFSFLCGLRVDPGAADFRLIDRRVLEELLKMQEGRVFFRGIFAWMGYAPAVVSFRADPRHSGSSQYSFRRMLKLATSGILSFSAVPLRLSIIVGLVTAVLSFCELLFVLIAWLLGSTQPGWASTMGVLSLLFGLLFLLLGVQGEYILMIHERVRRRPTYIVQRRVGRPDGKGAPGDAAASGHDGQPDTANVANDDE